MFDKLIGIAVATESFSKYDSAEAGNVAIRLAAITNDINKLITFFIFSSFILLYKHNKILTLNFIFKLYN